MAVLSTEQRDPEPSWANMASRQPMCSANEPAVPLVTDGTTAVVDTNAVVSLSGSQVAALADRLVTLRDVVEESRDKRTREMLQSLPVTLHLLEPSEEAVAAVTRFARASGDYTSLSTVDMRLIALAWMLEVATYGSGHLRAMPLPPKPKPRMRDHRRRLPGWGQSGGTWTQMDRLDEEAEAAAAAASSSRAPASSPPKGHVSTDPRDTTCEQPGSNTGSSDDDRCQLDGADVSHIAAGVQTIDLSGEGAHEPMDDGSLFRNHVNDDDVASASMQQGQQAGAASGSEDMSDDGKDRTGGNAAGNAAEGEWQTAASSRNAQRRRKRKHLRYVERGQHRQHAALDHAAALQQGSDDGSDDDWESTNGSTVTSSAIDIDSSASTSLQGGLDVLPPSDSRIASVTADFSMQNVILQMGLRLTAPDGRRITRLSRWVLRCSACTQICKEAGRLFCPQCGNATLDKVEVIVDSAGQEQYGVRKRHNLRGTRFSLPKPKGGRQTGTPILREDVMLQRMPHMRSGNKGQDVDLFTAEAPSGLFSSLNGEPQRRSTSAAVRHSAGVAAILAEWKRNPNERKHMRTNRRK